MDNIKSPGLPGQMQALESFHRQQGMPCGGEQSRLRGCEQQGIVTSPHQTTVQRERLKLPAAHFPASVEVEDFHTFASACALAYFKYV